MSEWSQPASVPATGHAAVGFVVGQRFPDGSKPDHVRIEYQDKHSDEPRFAVVRRESAGQQVEDTPSEFARFWTPENREIRVAELYGAMAVEVDDNE